MRKIRSKSFGINPDNPFSEIGNDQGGPSSCWLFQNFHRFWSYFLLENIYDLGFVLFVKFLNNYLNIFLFPFFFEPYWKFNFHFRGAKIRGTPKKPQQNRFSGKKINIQFFWLQILTDLSYDEEEKPNLETFFLYKNPSSKSSLANGRKWCIGLLVIILVWMKKYFGLRQDLV